MQFPYKTGPYLRITSLLWAAFLVTNTIYAQQAAPAQPIDNAARTTLSGNVHPLARAEFDRGEAPSDLPLKRMLLVLKRRPEQESALRKLLDDQQDTSSPSYHRWLTPAEFGGLFGPADSDIQALSDWLRLQGFSDVQIANGRTVIEFSGTAGLVKQAFGTAIHKIVVNQEEHWANVADPSIPTAFATVVAGIDSLHNFEKKAQSRYLGVYSEQDRSLTPSPDFTFGCGQGFSCYALTPYDFATIYNLLPLWNAGTPIDGSGQTIAIVGRTDINPTDATDFWTLFGLDGVRAPQPTLTITYNGINPGVTEDEAEADIDTQWSGAAAPGATINFVTSASTETTDGVDLSSLYIVDNNVAPVMSASYGLCEKGLGSGGVQFYGLLWQQAAAQGISVFVSSGDNGSAGCDWPGAPARNGLAVNGLASTPFNAAVGGTDFDEYQKWSTYWNASNDPVTHASAKGYIPETTWNDSCTNPLLHFLQGGSTNAETNCNNPNFSGFLDSIGGSGGKSSQWTKPSWQTGTPSDNARDLPDISLFSSDGFLGSFYIICQKSITGFCNLSNFAGYGGTSVASPAFAGIMAMVNQKWGVQGNPNFVLYKLPAKQANAFHDIPAGTTIAMPCLTGSPNCTTNTNGHTYGVLSGYATATGYDLATGLGSIDAANLVNNWNKVTFTPSVTTLTLNSGNPVSVTHGASVPVNIGVTPGSPVPTGDVALMLSPGTPGNPGFDRFTLTNGTMNAATSLLPGGSYSVIAHYAGDNTYGGSYSNATSVVVNPEGSSLYMPGLVTGTDANGNPIYATSVVYGSPYLLRADVKNSQGSFCNPPPSGHIACPTGTVTFKENGQPLDDGTYSLNSLGYTEDLTIQLPGGTHTLAGQYAGDNSFLGSSATLPVTITPASTWINYVYPSGWYLYVNQPFSIRAEVISGSLGVPETGTFTFFADGAPLAGNISYVFSGHCGNQYYVCLDANIDGGVFTTSGKHTLSVTYNGDSNYSSSSSSPQEISAYYTTTTTLTADPINPPAGGTTTLIAVVDTPAKNLTPTGGVQFSYYGGAQIPGTVTITPITDPSGNSAIQATLSFRPNSNHVTIAAVYLGDSNYLQSGSGPYNITVDGTDFDFAAGGNEGTVTPGQTLVVSFGIDGQLNYNGTVNFSSSSCSGLPKESSCSFSPQSVTGTGYTSLELSTTAPHQIARAETPSGRLAAGWIFATIALIGVFVVPSRKMWRVSISLLVLAATLFFLSCGGGSSGGGGGGHTDPGTPKGNYVITVTAKTADGTLSHSASFTLHVQ